MLELLCYLIAVVLLGLAALLPSTVPHRDRLAYAGLCALAIPAFVPPYRPTDRRHRVTEPDIEPAPIAPTGPACGLCGDPAVVHWQRRLTPDEITDEQAKEQARRDEAVLLADPALPLPEFGPLPDCTDYTRAVHGCINHAITKDAASLVHQSACTAPAANDLPGCDCTPEPPPKADPIPEPVQLPAGW